MLTILILIKWLIFHRSLFWFYNGNAITDEPMFDALKASKEEAKEAINVWIKLAAVEEVTKRNASAFQNLSTLYLNSAFKKATISKNNLEKGITLKLKFLDSDFINDFIKLSSDETYKVSKEAIQIQFLTQVYSQIEKVDATLVDWYLECISKISFTAKQNYLNDFVSKPIEHIKTRIEETKAKRKEKPSKGYDLGLILFENENEKIKTIQNILGKSNIQFTSISDKLSDEILQCGIVYFKKFRDSDTDPSAKAMDLFKKAKKLAVGSIAIQRCQENTENLQEWIDEKPERDKHNRISTDLTALIEIFVINNCGKYFSQDSFISDSMLLNVGLSNGSKIYSYNLVPKSGKKYLEPFLVNKRCIKSVLISSLAVCVNFKYFPSVESLKGNAIPYVIPFAIYYKYSLVIISYK